MSTAEPSGSFADQMVRGSAWMVAMRWALRLVGMASTVVLARLLVPADFGIVAMAMVIAGLLDTAAYAGVDLALIRIQGVTREHRNSAWTIQVLQGVFVAAILVIAAPFAASYYNEPRVAIVIQWLAAKSLIDGFHNIGVVEFRRELDFAKEFRFGLYSKVLNLVIVIAAAVMLRNYIALIIGMVSGSVISVVLSYAMHPYRPWFSLARVRHLWSFSNWLLLSRVGSFLTRKADQFIIGGVVGATVLGNYHVATEVSTMPTSELVMPLRRALFPTLSLLQDDPEAFRAAVIQTFSVLSMICFAAGFGLVAVAGELVPILLGDQWHGVVPLVQWLSIYGTFAGLASLLEVPMWVKGKAHVSALQSWFELVLVIPTILIAVHTLGIDGAAMARAVVAVLVFPLMLYLTYRICRVKIGDLIAASWRALVAAVAMAICLMQPWPYPAAPVLALLTKIVFGAALFASALLCLWLVSGRPSGVEETLLRRVRISRGGR